MNNVYSLAKAFEGMLGADQVPVALLSTQAVAGTNYCVLCEQAVIYPGAVPEYVFWSLRRDKNRITMMQNSSGSTAFGTISSGLIASLPITLLPLHEQRIIGNLLRLSEREQELLNKLAEEKKTYNTLLLNQIYDNMKRGNI